MIGEYCFATMCDENFSGHKEQNNLPCTAVQRQERLIFRN